MKINFDEAAKNWDSDIWKQIRASDVAKDMLKFLYNTQGMNALEYGCGTGLLGFYLLPYFKNITFCDSSQGMLDQVKNKIEEKACKNCDTILLDHDKPFDTSKKYDCIFNLMILHHIDNVEDIIKNWSEALNKGGYLCIADLEEEDGSFHGKEFSGHKGFSKGKLTEIFKKNNFDLITISQPHITKKQKSDGEIVEYPIFLVICKKN